jgi:hypothetical protein
MTMTLFSDSHQFRAWLYTPSHNTLILRGEGVTEDGQNIDLKFAGVFYAEIIPMYRGLLIRRPTIEQVNELRARLMMEDTRYDRPHPDDPKPNGGYYLLESQGISYMIACSFLAIHYNRYPYYTVTPNEGELVIG